MRRKLAQTLVDFADKDPNVVFITADLGYGVFDEFKDKFPDRYLNVGIAEAGMVTLAAGLASEGWKPYVYSIASFLLPKTYEQIRLLLAHNGNKVVVIGAGGGFAYSMSGPSHHALDDLSLALLIPEMNVFAPSGPQALVESLRTSYESTSSSYIQIGKFGEPDVPEVLDLEGSEFAIVSLGTIANDVFAVLQRIPEAGSKISFLNVNQINPLPAKKLGKFLINKKRVIAIEETWGKLSLYSLLREFCEVSNFELELLRIGPKHQIFDENLERETRLTNMGLSVENIRHFLFNSEGDIS